MCTLKHLTLTLSLLLTLGLLGACETDVGTTVEDIADPDVGTVGDGYLGAQELYEGYNRYLGQTVTVTGEIAEIYGPNTFLIGERLWGESLLVVVPDDATVTGTSTAGMPVTGFPELERDFVLQVTGTAQQYVQLDVERDYGIDLDPELEVEVEETEPMIVADSVRVMTEREAEALGYDV